MANALGGLFSDIAAAIRSKTGEEGSMKPTDFPEKINNISVRDLSLLPIAMVSGEFEPDAPVYTFEHNLGRVPDILIVYGTTVETNPELGSFLTFAVGFGDKMMDLLLTQNDYPGRVVYTIIYSLEGEGKYGTTMRIGDNCSIVDCVDQQQTYGNLRSATDTTCTVGGTMIPMKTTVIFLTVIMRHLRKL